MTDDLPFGSGPDGTNLTADRPQPQQEDSGADVVFVEEPPSASGPAPVAGLDGLPWELVAPAPLSGDGGWLAAPEPVEPPPVVTTAPPAERVGVRPPPQFEPGSPAGRVDRPLRVNHNNQGWFVRLGDQLAAPLYRHRRQTVTLLSLIVLALLCWVAIGQLNLFGAGS